MTDRSDFPDNSRSENREDPTDAADARWFRATVAPVVDTKRVPDAWDDIRARATGEAPTDVRLAPAADRPTPTPRRRMALVAAAVMAVAGLGGAVAVTRGSDDGTDETVVAAPPDGNSEATGWYIPEDVPPGWKLESVETDWLDWGETESVSCPCDTTSWISGDDAIVLYKFVGELPGGRGAADDAETPVQLGDGVTGHLHEQGPITGVQWEFDAHVWSLSARGLTSDQVVEAATAIFADPSLGTSPLDGFTALADVTVSADPVAYHSVLVTFVNEGSGRRASYGLIPEGLDPGSTFLLSSATRSPAVFEPQDLPLLQFDLDDQADAGEKVFVGHWPGAHVFIGRYAEPTASDPMTGSDLAWLAAALRPATSSEWSEFLDTDGARVEDDARTDSLRDLIVHEDDGRAAGLDSEPGDDATATTTFSSDQPDPEGSGPAGTHVVTTPSGLEAMVTLPSSVPEGESLTVRWILGNPTDAPIRVDTCAWQVVRVGEPLDLETAGQVGCHDQRNVRMLDPGDTFGGTTTFNSEREPVGRYEAVKGGPGGDDAEAFRVPFEVSPND